MAFVSTLTNGIGRIDLVVVGSSRAAIVLVGYDDEVDISYETVVALDVMAGGDTELAFFLRARGEAADDVHDYWSGRDVGRFIGARDRARILAAALEATEELVRRHQPDRVFMFTYDADLPAKALRKHFRIADVFTKCGYTVRPAETWHGRLSWWAERVEPAGASSN